MPLQKSNIRKFIVIFFGIIDVYVLQFHFKLAKKGPAA